MLSASRRVISNWRLRFLLFLVLILVLFLILLLLLLLFLLFILLLFLLGVIEIFVFHDLGEDSSDLLIKEYLQLLFHVLVELVFLTELFS